MKTYTTQAQVEADVANGTLAINDHVTFECDINLPRVSINARDIHAGDIHAGGIHAGDIHARDIKYYAFCAALKGIVCASINGRRSPCAPPVCLDGELVLVGGA